MNKLLKAATAGGIAALLILGATLPSSAQIVVHRYGGAQVYVGPGYDAYAYSPGYRSHRTERYQDYPAGYDTGGMPFSRRELGWQGAWPGGSPANPCYPGLRAQNRC